MHHTLKFWETPFPTEALHQQFYETRLLHWQDERNLTEEQAEGEALREAKQYHANLQKFMTLLHDRFSETFVTLGMVYEWLRTAIATDDDEDEQPVESTAQVVVMTVHKAKGLEFERMVLPLTDRTFIWKPATDFVVDTSSNEPRIGWKLNDRQNANYASIRSTEESETWKEEARLLYVALTRTERHLHVIRSQHGDQNWGTLLKSLE